MITDSEIWKILRWEAVCALILWLTCNTMLEKLLAANVVYDTSDDIKQTNDEYNKKNMMTNIENKLKIE